VAQRVAESERGARRIRAPRFLMALPAWIWFIFFFTLPVLWIVYYSFGYKPDIYHPIATDKLSFATYHEAFSSTFLHVFSQTLQISTLRRKRFAGAREQTQRISNHGLEVKLHRR